MTLRNVRILNGNSLKLIAAALMLTDHIGMIFFPKISLLRIIGRLSFPIFAFFIAEGCRHTRNKLRYFLSLALSGTVFHIVYTLFTGDDYMNILITFALAVPLIYALEFVKRALLKRSARESVLWISVLFSAAVLVWLFHGKFTVSYGFAGSIVPVASSLFSPVDGEGVLSEDMALTMNTVSAGVALAYLSSVLGGLQIYCLLALPLLLAYSGKRGKRRMKYFFYVFYPAHLVVLQGIAMLIK